MDGSARVGPSWQDLYGETETLKDGSTAQVDEAYLQSFIRDPQARGVNALPAKAQPNKRRSDDQCKLHGE